MCETPLDEMQFRVGQVMSFQAAMRFRLKWAMG
jgi:hypothetical protein